MSVRGSSNSVSSRASVSSMASSASSAAAAEAAAAALLARDRRFQAAQADGRRFDGLERSDAAADESYTFVQLADPQFGMLAFTAGLQWWRSLRPLVRLATCGRNDGRALIPVPELGAELEDLEEEALLEMEIELSQRAVKAVNRLTPRPRFAIVCGDLVNAYPAQSPRLNAEQVEIFKDIYSQVHPDIKLVCVCGNHDIGDRPTPATISLWKQRFGADYFSFWVGKDKFLVLNSQLYKNGGDCPDQVRAQNQWLDAELAAGGARHSVAFSHIPPFISDPEEPSGDFPLPKKTRLPLLRALSEHGVSHWFCGHYHRNAGGMYELKAEGEGQAGQRARTLEVVTTGAIGGNLTTDELGDALSYSGMGRMHAKEALSGLRVVTVTPTGVSHEFRNLRELRIQQREHKREWTAEEDATIMEMKNGGHVEHVLKRMPSRSRLAVRQRFRSLSEQQQQQQHQQQNAQ